MRPEAAESLGGAGLHLPDWSSVLEKTKVRTGRLTAPGTSPEPAEEVTERREAVKC